VRRAVSVVQPEPARFDRPTLRSERRRHQQLTAYTLEGRLRAGSHVAPETFDVWAEAYLELVVAIEEAADRDRPTPALVSEGGRERCGEWVACANLSGEVELEDAPALCLWRGGAGEGSLGEPEPGGHHGVRPPAKRNANAARRAGDGGYKNEMRLLAFLPSEEKK